jgi:hypothetical protein
MCDLWCTKWHREGVLSQYFCFPLSVSFHQCSILIFIYMLLLAERQTGEACELSKKLFPFQNRGALHSEVFLRCFCLRRVNTVYIARSEGTPCYVTCVGEWHQFAQFVCRWFYQWLEPCEIHVIVQTLLEYPVDAVELNGLFASCRTDSKTTE